MSPISTPPITRRGALALGAAAVCSALPSANLYAGIATRSCEGRVRLSGGCRLAYREYGRADGPLVFYFHGTPGSRLEASLVDNEARQAGIRLVSVDRPGLGLSSYQPNRNILDWPGHVEQLACALGYADRPFGVVGMSGGAPYAAACALRIPHRLTHVAIVSGHAPIGAPGVCPGNQDKLIELVSRRQRLAKVVFRLSARRLKRRPDKVLENVTKGWTAADRQLMLCHPQHRRDLIANLNEASRCGPEGAVKDIRLLWCQWGFSLCAIEYPAVTIWQGGCDRVVTPSMGHYFHRQIAGSELVVDPTAGHVTMLKHHAAEIFSQFA